ncbi:purine-nucleoside phosphorylase [Aliivibrio fischeri]|uniref:Purine nucleoside phosphorylase DeoD-type n=4 Tax=Aliivibrio fischeri TaxID=668 RepID=DEOD3_ALIF1|nr:MULTISPECIES: purine-nucleoside phosphorylase [Aliivibrio]Q5DYV8.1 RecName: Full=Purine nucleoside phosphorylase DeoD-type; Short=PNP [Aliivibrio fischeri ES114]AAW88038.1 purine nucleoside phosphorylase deoD-type; PNP [Aliivibrio fischeri ES114]EHN68337.1 purine nucleoside phosphorylase [Aliivibrio fischeri SR5]KLU80514.1 purine nucleoside phosphorylase [Aliivibrio fischeri]MBD1569648.1 purine-nucleoside phosphorylase [Aliivibrio sp. S10_S31]MBP3139800.1 purine-nucleoside phosphorylase [A
MSTPHINAPLDAFADTILMPGDPLRAKLIAETYLENVVQVTDVRGMLGFTGEFKGRKISVMGHGMGAPSASIYFHELMTTYKVKNFIRIGSCGAIHDDVKLKDLIVAIGASTDSKMNRIRFKDNDFAATANYNMLSECVNTLKTTDINYLVGNVFSSDLFYRPDEEQYDMMARYGILGVEMEVNALYSAAAENHCNAVALCTVTDHIKNHEHLTADERRTELHEMINVALDVALKLPTE